MLCSSEKTEEKIHDIIERLRCSKKNGQGLTHSDMSTIRLLILNHDIKGKHDLVYLALPARTLNRRKDPVYKTNDMMVLKGEYEATKRKKKRKKRQQYFILWLEDHCSLSETSTDMVFRIPSFPRYK